MSTEDSIADSTRADVVIVGAGPAGLNAARAASESGARIAKPPRIVIVDENPHVGGQIWRRSAPAWARDLIAGARRHNIDYLPGMAVIQQCADRVLLAAPVAGSAHRPVRLGYSALIIATGARELFLPFPGWTLPGVMGAGGLQAMAKSGMDVAGKRIVVAGSGPLLLAVAAYLKKHGAVIPAIIEQASGSAINRFALGLIGHPQKLVQGAMLRASLLGVPYRTDSWIVRAEGAGTVRAVIVHRGGAAAKCEEKLDCDLVACGFGLVPNTQLAAILGCHIEHASVTVGPLQETSVAGVYCAGEPTGIGGVDLASIEGQIAGHAAAGDIAAARALAGARVKAWRFAGRLNTAFELRDELKALASDDTVVCRCEDVRHSDARRYPSWRETKLQTRCGMGPCQGRICGPICRYLFGMEPTDTRPPISPVSVETLGHRSR